MTKQNSLTNWESELDALLEQHDQQQKQAKADVGTANLKAEEFISLKVVPAFEEVKVVLQKRGREVKIGKGFDQATITVRFQDVQELDFRVKTRIYPNRVVAYAETRSPSSDGKLVGESHFRSDTQDYSLDNISKDEIIRHLLEMYKDRLDRPYV